MSDGPSNLPSSNDTVNDPPQDTQGAPSDDRDVANAETPAADVGSPEQAEEDPAQAKRDNFLHDLLRELDMLVYIELAAIYYLDTSNILLALRTLLHLTHLTLPSLTSPSLHPALRKAPLLSPNTPLLLAASVLCFFIHLYTSPPSASELTRFYLHGSLLVDFVGQFAQEGWWTKLRLCIMDVVVVICQGVCCAAAGERARVNGSRGVSGATSESATAIPRGAAAGPGISAAAAAWAAMSGRRMPSVWARQATDAPSMEGTRTGGAAIEMANLTRSGRAAPRSDTDSSPIPHAPDNGESSVNEENVEDPRNSHVANEREGLLTGLEDPSASTTIPHPQEPAAGGDPLHHLEQLYAGQTIIADLHLVDMLRNHFWDARNRRLARRGGVGV